MSNQEAEKKQTALEKLEELYSKYTHYPPIEYTVTQFEDQWTWTVRLGTVEAFDSSTHRDVAKEQALQNLLDKINEGLSAQSKPPDCEPLFHRYYYTERELVDYVQYCPRGNLIMTQTQIMKCLELQNQTSSR